MNIAFGHSNMDMDCLGSLVLVKKLFPDYRLVKSNLIHPVARKVYNIYQDYFNFLSPDDLKDETIDDVLIVDTCIASRVKEYFNNFKNPAAAIRVIDHHNLEDCDIPRAQKEGAPFGANVTCLGKLAMARRIKLVPEEATIALAGLYADTGRLIYENVCREDFEVSAYLMDMGASLKLVKTFLESLTESEQIGVLNQVFLLVDNAIDIQGHSILITCLPLDDNINGLAAVVDKVMEVENPDAYFAFFSIPRKNTVLLIARSQKAKIDVNKLLQPYGGGGHQAAASLKLIHRDMKQFSEEFRGYLEKSLKPATRARDIMTRDVEVIKEDVSLLDASRFLEEIDLTGIPVVNAQGSVSGFLSLRDIMKGRRASQMHAPVKAYMTRNVITSDGYITMREVERLFYKHHINHIPIVEGGKLQGIVTHGDYLRYKRNQGILT
ncbi:MAG: CBS domain-containing protein [Spirochaetaceae bacterium]|jgi:tRNA nucleotidyltransferase (CCA-adding enzyme)|nr:CBS domain-containing protein [Spirochaetaceae bacterium]